MGRRLSGLRQAARGLWLCCAGNNQARWWLRRRHNRVVEVREQVHVPRVYMARVGMRYHEHVELIPSRGSDKDRPKQIHGLAWGGGDGIEHS